MNEQELLDLKIFFIKLKELVYKYGGRYYKIQLEILENIIECINSELSIAEKELYVLRNYRNLYPDKGGLSDFYIDSDNFEERLKLNKPLDEINDGVWGIIKKYL